MRLHRNLNEGTVYAEKAWIDFIEKITTEVENSPGKREIMETNLVPMGKDCEENTGDIFALIRGPVQGLGRIFNNNIDESTTRLIVNMVQNCHFLKLQIRNKVTNQDEKLDLLVGHNTPWEEVKNVIENYTKKLPGFGDDGIKTYGYITDEKIKNFDLVRRLYNL